MFASHNGNRRLDSWKEIAAHLGRNERTAIRWEKRGLPVHRVPGGQRQAVFAFTDEIDAWLVNQDGKTAVSDPSIETVVSPNHERTENQPIPTAAPDITRAAERAHPYGKWAIVIAGICVLVVATILRLPLVHSRTSAWARPFRLAQLTDDGKFKAYFRTDGTTLYLNEMEGTQAILVAKPVGGGPARPIHTPFDDVILEDISSDGRSLLITSFQGIESGGPLWIMPVDGSTARRVGDVLCSWARWSPDNHKIACASGTSIAILSSDGSDANTVASFRYVPSGLLWSPDGQQLRFLLRDTANSASSWQLTFETRNGQEKSTLSKLEDGKNVCWDWVWTKHGDHLVCLTLDPERKSSLFVMPSDASWNGKAAGDAELPVKLQTIVGLVPGKSGNSLYVLVANPYRGELLRFDAKRKTFEAYLQQLSAYYVSFSRDGRWMTYVNSVDQTLWRSRVDGTEPLQLTKASMEVEVSSWSPDGKRIAFMGKEPEKPWRIFLVGRDGGIPVAAAEGNDNQGGPSWSPDGKEIVYANVDCNPAQMCWIRRAELATGKTVMLPGSYGFRTARWSPDGQYIAALQPGTQELMLFNVRRRRWTKLADAVNGDNINWSSDSKSIFVDCPRGRHPAIERIRVTDGRRTTAASLVSLQNVFGTMGTWVGLTPDNSPILFHSLGSSEVYSMEWTDR